MSSQPTTFNLEYILSVGLALSGVYYIQSNYPNTMPFIKFFVIPFLIAFVALTIFNGLLKNLNNIGQKAFNFIENKSLNTIESSNYMQVFPPIMAVFVIFMIVLYNLKFIS